MLKRVLDALVVLALVLVLNHTMPVHAQFVAPWSGSTVPATCQYGTLFFKTTAPVGMYFCGAADTWTMMAGMNAYTPSGSLMLLDTGTCPVGYSEISTMTGRTFITTLAANGDVGTTGGTDNITPTGTVSTPTFTGSALAGHSHELPFQISSATVIRALASSIFGTGTSRAAAGTFAPTVNTTSAAVALSQSVTAGTPAGTVSTPTFSGVSFDNRQAFIKVIACRKS